MGFEGFSIFSPNWKSFNPHLWRPRHQPWWVWNLVGMSLQVYTTYNYLLVTPDQEVVTVRQSVMSVQWSCTPEVKTVTHVKVLINHTSFEISVQTVMQKGWPLVLGVLCVCVLLSKFFWKFWIFDEVQSWAFFWKFWIFDEVQSWARSSY